MGATRRKFSREFKLEAVRQLEAGRRLAEIALGDQTLDRLRRRAPGRGMELRERRHRAREPVGPRQVAQRAPLGGGEPFGITMAVGDSPELNHQLGDRPWARFQASGHAK